MSFRERGHAQLHPLVAGFRPPRPRLSGVPAWEKEKYPGDRNRTGLQLERVQSNAPAGGLQTASRPRREGISQCPDVSQKGNARDFASITHERHGKAQPSGSGSQTDVLGIAPHHRRNIFRQNKCLIAFQQLRQCHMDPPFCIPRAHDSPRRVNSARRSSWVWAAADQSSTAQKLILSDSPTVSFRAAD